MVLLQQKIVMIMIRPTIVDEDADCDGVVTAEDCDDNNTESSFYSNDGDCDGVVTAEDCDNN